MKSMHKKCPVNLIDRSSSKTLLTTHQISQVIDDANRLNFDGYIAFHYYNEPLLYIDRIMQIITIRPQQRYLLWSNGVLIDEIQKAGYQLNVFSKIVLTCYDLEYMPFFEQIQKEHPDVEIGIADMDDRLIGYDSTYENLISCKKVFYELPINCYGDVVLCTHDWKNSFKLGNIQTASLHSIVTGSVYQNLLNGARKVKIQENAPTICRSCQYAHLTYHKGNKLLNN